MSSQLIDSEGSREIPFGWSIEEYIRPLIIRQYTGLLSAADTNARFLLNLSRGQTGLSVAFDLATQLELDLDDELAIGQVGEVGVPISHIGDMRRLFQGIDLRRINTSMTINSPATWLAALYCAGGIERGIDPSELKFTVQNDLAKEFIARGAYVLDPETSRRFQLDMFRYCIKHSPRSRAMNACGYHLGECGATPPMEMGFAIANAFHVLDSLKELADRGEISKQALWECARNMAFFVWVGEDVETQVAKFRAAHMIWDEQLHLRYGITDPSYRVLVMGGQSSSIHLTRQQPENNIFRCGSTTYSASWGGLVALQISCADEAFRTPTETLQQLALRTQQVAYYETGIRSGKPRGRHDLFIGSSEDKWYGSRHMEERTAKMKQAMEAEIVAVESQGSDEERLRYEKRRLLIGNRDRLQAIEHGGVDERNMPFGKPLVGVNCFTEEFPDPLIRNLDLKPQNNPEREEQLIRDLQDWKRSRDPKVVERALRHFERTLVEGGNSVEAQIVCALSGCTGGEIGAVKRRLYGEYRPANALELLSDQARETSVDISRGVLKTEQFEQKHGHRIKGIIGATGLDGHSSGSEQIAIRAVAVGMEVVYLGNRRRAAELAERALQNGADFIGISIMSGAVLSLTRAVLSALESRGIGNTALVIGGIISDAERIELLAIPSVVAVFTPADYDLTVICETIVDCVDKHLMAA